MDKVLFDSRVETCIDCLSTDHSCTVTRSHILLSKIPYLKLFSKIAMNSYGKHKGPFTYYFTLILAFLDTYPSSIALCHKF